MTKGVIPIWNDAIGDLRAAEIEEPAVEQAERRCAVSIPDVLCDNVNKWGDRGTGIEGHEPILTFWERFRGMTACLGSRWGSGDRIRIASSVPNHLAARQNYSNNLGSCPAIQLTKVICLFTGHGFHRPPNDGLASATCDFFHLDEGHVQPGAVGKASLASIFPQPAAISSISFNFCSESFRLAMSCSSLNLRRSN